MNLGFGTRAGLFFLRILVGVQFLLAAWSKVWPEFKFSKFESGWLKQPELKAFLESFAKDIRPELGFFKDIMVEQFIPHADTLTYCVVFGEALVGIALVIGLLTRISGLFGALMTATFFLATWQAGPIAYTAFKNPAFITMALCFVVILSGAGLCGGLDGKIRKPKD